ncbi:hypothetical protein OF846_001593 [Rhodotorula toruloides]|nr:hypothetical protein OF846_001593 [Rhodotorula toruloides]
MGSATKARPSRMPAFGQKPIGQQVAEARGRPSQPLPQASETKSEAIMQDAQDPSFARNLAALGQVKVPGKGEPTTHRTDNPMLGILAERQRVEEAAEQKVPVRNQLSAGGLLSLFDARKNCTTQEELDKVSREYGMEPAMVEELAKHINSPSMSGITIPGKTPDDAERHLKMNAHAQPTAPAVNAPVHPQPSTSSLSAGAGIAQEYAAHYADLANHLLAGYTSCDFSDVQLVASLADGQQHTLALHSVVVSRSPLLRHLIQAALASAPRPTIFVNIPDPAVNANTLGLVLASLYSPTVLSHLNPEIAPSVLAVATFLSLTRLANLAYEMCEAAVREAKTPEEVMRWVAYVERERAAEGAPGSATPITFGGPAMNGASIPPSPSPSTNSTSPLLPPSVNGSAAPVPALYESRLRVVLLDRITRLPAEMGAFAPATEAQAQPALVNVLKRLPFEMFKAVVEDKRFEAPGDMERFNFAKKVVAARKALVQQSASPSSPPPEFEEAVVLLFGGGAGGSAVNVLRKQRKPTLWKISNAM